MKGWVRVVTSVSKGFTIVELLIVIVVIGVLAAIIFLGYGAVQSGAYDASIKSDLKRFSDTIHLKALDDDAIPPGGATSSMTGDSTQLPNIQVEPDEDSYDGSVSNLYYCAGTLDGTEAFGLLARSISGKAFKYLSTSGESEFTGSFTWAASNDGAGACTGLGFSAPYTWSYGYNPNPSYLWFSWAEPS